MHGSYDRLCVVSARDFTLAFHTLDHVAPRSQTADSNLDVEGASIFATTALLVGILYYLLKQSNYLSCARTRLDQRCARV